MTVRTRFAPSPTGLLHIGGVRTALFNWLLARHHGGQFLLRIDDTDQQRHVEDALARILDGFRWMGMDWDEGPEVGGPHGPYFQSQRAESYRQAAAALIASGHVYRDYSTQAERDADRDALKKSKQAYRFREKIHTDEELARFEAEGRTYGLRFRVPSGRTLVVHDLIKGDVESKTDEIGDFVIVRPDGMPLYNFATVVDDIAMKISHVVRADEHLTNTFPQLLLFEALGAELPQFAHIPFVAEKGSKAKLSKRKTDAYAEQGILVLLNQYIEKGYMPEAMMNYLSRLGWSLDGNQEIFTQADLIASFSLDRVTSAPASHDPDKLFWVQGEWMKTLGTAEKAAAVLPYLRAEGLVPDPISPDFERRLAWVIEALGDRLKVYSDILNLGRYFFTDAMSYDPAAVKKRLRKDGIPEVLTGMDQVLATLEPYTVETLETATHGFAEANNLSMGIVVNAVRVATTGQGVGPGLYDCLAILGRDLCRTRITQTLAMLAESASQAGE